MMGIDLLLTVDYPPRKDGGVAYMMRAFAQGARQLGQPLRVLTPHHPGTRADDMIPLWGRSWRRHMDLWIRLQLPKYLWQFDPDYLFCADHAMARAVLKVVGGAGRRVQVLAFTHGNELAPKPSAKAKMIQTLKGVDYLIVPNHWCDRQLDVLGIDPAKRIHRPPAIGQDFEAPLGQEMMDWAKSHLKTPYILCLSRLVKRKGHAALIDGFAHLKDKYSDWHLYIAGQGPEALALHEKIGSLGLNPRVHMLGFVSDNQRRALYAHCDLYAMLSHERNAGRDIEGFGITYLEAGFYGKAVLATGGGGVSDAVLDGITGRLLPDFQDTAALIGALDQLMGDQNLRRRLGTQGAQRVQERFRAITMVDDIYGVLNGHRPGGE